MLGPKVITLSSAYINNWKKYSFIIFGNFLSRRLDWFNWLPKLFKVILFQVFVFGPNLIFKSFEDRLQLSVGSILFLRIEKLEPGVTMHVVHFEQPETTKLNLTDMYMYISNLFYVAYFWVLNSAKDLTTRIKVFTNKTF